jgi:acetolactate synthase-1/2/3 large subunit
MEKGSDAVASFLASRGVTVVFGIIGGANSRIYNSFMERGFSIYNVHNEQSAVLAAGAYWRASGKIAAVTVTSGGGVTNTITGLVSLWADSTPTIVISGQESTESLKKYKNRRMYGVQGFDVVSMVKNFTKYSKLVDTIDTLRDDLNEAWASALNGRKGPVWLDIPSDIQSKTLEISPWMTFIPLVTKSVDVDKVEALLKTSQRPVILAGHGIKLSDSEKDFKEMITRIKIPVLVSWSAIDILSSDHPLYFGSPGIYGKRSSNFILQKSDLVIVLGSRLAIPQTGYDLKEYARNATIIMVDIDENEFRDFAHVHILSDCGEMIRAMDSIFIERSEWLEDCNSIRKEFPLIEAAHEDEEFPNSYKIIDKISEFITPDHVIVTDMGTALLSGHQSIRLKDGTRMFTSYGLGEMGYGLPAAIGACISRNGSEVLCLNCDGGMMMNIQELQTIIYYKLRVKIVIFNNDGYLMMKHTQKLLFNGKLLASNTDTGISLPDYMNVAEAFGYEKFRIKSWDDFCLNFPTFMAHDGPAICEVFMPPEQEFIPKVKGVVMADGSIFAPPLEEMSPLLSLNDMKNIMGNCISSKSSLIERTSHGQ